MNTTLKPGDVLAGGFEVVEVMSLNEMNAAGVYVRHQRSGLEVFHVLNDDAENLFAFAFATAPEDSSGVAHIIEHTVLCGSEHYPLKDAFIVLAQGSLQTYLNAWTFPDKTVYPASSFNEHDYFNLMAVYGDAVFHPKLDEWMFMQEGHRLEYRAQGGKEALAVTGIVYNEMKGAYSALDEYAGHWATKAVLPDTIYAFDSGGDPAVIPSLRYEEFRAFHKQKYRPANCKVFLAGNIPTEKQLAFINEKFLTDLEAGTAAPPVTAAKRWDAPQNIYVAAPAGGEDTANVFLSWLCVDAEGPEETLALNALAEILLGHDGSPLCKALVESGLGEDLASVCGIEDEIKEPVFSAGLRGVKKAGVKNAGKAVEDLILGELRALVTKGIPKEEIEAALLSMEFSNLEIRRAHGPYALVWLRRSLRRWIHGGKPWDGLLFAPHFAALKKALAADGRYFERLIQKQFLDNPHRALVVVQPEKDFLKKQEKALRDFIGQKERSLSEAERGGIREKNAALSRIQGRPESPEELAVIPHLRREELANSIETVPRRIENARVLAVTHRLFTNGISYCDFAFPVDVLDAADYAWLPLFSRCIGALGLPGLSYAEVSSLLARTVGDFYTMLRTGSSAPGVSEPGVSDTMVLDGQTVDLCGRDWLIYRLKTLDSNIVPSLELVRRIIAETDFSDLRRLRDLVVEMKNDCDSSLAPYGNAFAMGRAGRNFSRAKGIEELWNGVSALEFLHKLVKLDTAEIRDKLVAIRDKLNRNAGLIFNYTGENETETLRVAEREFSSFGLPRERVAETQNRFALSGDALSTTMELYASPSLQVGFSAMALPAPRYASPEAAAAFLLAHRLSTGALWENIRMKGGAYGAKASIDPMERLFLLSTYRDPAPQKSLDAFSAIFHAESKQRLDNDTLEKMLIGAYSKEKQPKTNSDKGFLDFLHLLCGVTDETRAATLSALLSVTADGLSAAAASLFGFTETAPRVIISGMAEARQTARELGVEIRKLPV